MKLKKALSISEIKALIDVRSSGKETVSVTGINEIHMVQPGDLTYVDHPKYYSKVLASSASVIIINKEVPCPDGKCLLISVDPFHDYNFLTKKYSPFLPLTKNISESAEIGEGTILQPGVVIGNFVRIGKNCILDANVVIYDRCEIGNNVVINANSVIGSDAFYYKKTNDSYEKMHSCGRVIIHDHVEMGSCCTIDRGVSGDTIIGEGTKLDNQVHVGHDTVVGKNCLFAAQVAIAGVVKVEDNVILWGQVGVHKDLTLGKGSMVYAQSGVGINLEENKTYYGSPAKEAMQRLRELTLLKKLPELVKKMESGE